MNKIAFTILTVLLFSRVKTMTEAEIAGYLDEHCTKLEESDNFIEKKNEIKDAIQTELNNPETRQALIGERFMCKSIFMTEMKIGNDDRFKDFIAIYTKRTTMIDKDSFKYQFARVFPNRCVYQNSYKDDIGFTARITFATERCAGFIANYANNDQPFMQSDK